MKMAIGRAMALTALVAALAACGGRQPLKPVEGQRLPALPIGAAAAPTGQQLVTPPTQARPERNVELLRQSDERKDDPFDLPPERNQGK